MDQQNLDRLWWFWMALISVLAIASICVVVWFLLTLLHAVQTMGATQ